MLSFKNTKNTGKFREIFADKLKFFTNLGIIFITLFFGISLIKNVIRVSQVKTRIKEGEMRVEKLKKDNEELRSKLAQINSDAFIEKKLRDNLGLAKEGETVVVLPDTETLRKLVPDTPREEDTLPEANWEKWMKLFF